MRFLLVPSPTCTGQNLIGPQRQPGSPWRVSPIGVKACPLRSLLLALCDIPSWPLPPGQGGSLPSPIFFCCPSHRLNPPSAALRGQSPTPASPAQAPHLSRLKACPLAGGSGQMLALWSGSCGPGWDHSPPTYQLCEPPRALLASSARWGQL